MRAAIAFLAGPEVPDYGGLLGRLRWRRAVAAQAQEDVWRKDPAAGAFAGADVWTVVLEPAAVPVGGGRFPEIPPGAAVAVRAAAQAPGGPAAHTLRELETGSGGALVEGAGERDAPLLAVAFRIADFPPRAGETVEGFLGRVARARPALDGGSLAAYAPGDPSRRERPELSRLIPAGVSRLADVGCGAGATGAALKSRSPGLSVTGIELDPAAAQRARAVLDRVIVGQARESLAALAAAGERFDGFLFGDVLEHTADPIGVLAAARSAATAGASLVASVPNTGHLSLVRDLILGRFDPVPAGLLDAGHLRWFTRPFLAEALEEAGWTPESIEGVPGAPALDAERFLASLAGWPGLDSTGLRVYQWIAVARAA